MKSALATRAPSAPLLGTVSSAAIAYECRWIRGTRPRWTFCTFPANVCRVTVPSG